MTNEKTYNHKCTLCGRAFKARVGTHRLMPCGKCISDKVARLEGYYGKNN